MVRKKAMGAHCGDSDDVSAAGTACNCPITMAEAQTVLFVDIGAHARAVRPAAWTFP
jgi:hypothetical protein